MTIDLTMLAWSAALCLALMLPCVTSGMTTLGVAIPGGNWIVRTEQARADLLDTLVPFAVLVLAVAVTGKANLMSALGAQIFFWASVADVVLYFAGATWPRTLAWVVSVAGMGLVAAALFQG